MRICSASSKETKQIAARLAKTISLSSSRSGALVLALEGNLGAGKTTFIQGFAKALGVKENVLSPTFVLMKVYKVRCRVSGVRCYPKHLIHIDCYRLDSPKDLLKDKDAVILIEWADRIRRIIPKDATWIKFEHGKRPSERVLRI